MINTRALIMVYIYWTVLSFALGKQSNERDSESLTSAAIKVATPPFGANFCSNHLPSPC